MKCCLCWHGETHPGKVTVVLHREQTIVIIKDVPADICENCGEYYLSEETTVAVLSRAEESLIRGAEVEILRYAA